MHSNFQILTRRLALLLILSAAALIPALTFADEQTDVDLDVPYEPSHPKVVEAMLKAGSVTKADLVYDLGCGDGRIVIAAAKEFGAHGVGIDIDEQRIIEAKERAKAAGVADKVGFKKENIFETDISPATVVTMYLLDEVNLNMRPRLFKYLKPGTRVVTHAFHMTDWKPDRVIGHDPALARITGKWDKQTMLWTIPAVAGGKWKWDLKTAAGAQNFSANIRQTFQEISGTVGQTTQAPFTPGKVSGKNIEMVASIKDGNVMRSIRLKGIIEGDTIKGTQEIVTGPGKGTYPWIAKMDPLDLSGKWLIKADKNDTFNGTLVLKKDGRNYTGVFEGDKKYDLGQLYVWGNSINFRLPLFGEENPAVYNAFLDGKSGDGTVVNTKDTFKTTLSITRAN